MPEPRRCRHLHTSGHQCGSPAVRHEKLCYQHLAATQRPAYTPSLPDPEDLHAVQRGLAELLRLVARELIEDRQARRLFAILTAAGTNLARIDRQQARAHELDLRHRALTLAESRLAGLSGCHSRRESAPPDAADPGCPTFATVSPSLRWDRSATDLISDPITDFVDDPILGLIAPGPDPEPRPTPDPVISTEAKRSGETPASRPSPTKPHPEQPSPARQRELDAEAAEQVEFMREENRRSEEREQLRTIAYELRYQSLSPERQLEEDRRRAQLNADFDRAPLPLAPYPKWGITPQPF